MEPRERTSLQPPASLKSEGRASLGAQGPCSSCQGLDLEDTKWYNLKPLFVEGNTSVAEKYEGTQRSRVHPVSQSASAGGPGVVRPHAASEGAGPACGEHCRCPGWLD